MATSFLPTFTFLFLREYFEHIVVGGKIKMKIKMKKNRNSKLGFRILGKNLGDKNVYVALAGLAGGFLFPQGSALGLDISPRWGGSGAKGLEGVGQGCGACRGKPRTYLKNLE